MEGHLQLGGHRTWYRVVGDLDASAPQAPVIICHGGPGATHDYVAPIAEQLQPLGPGLRPLRPARQRPLGPPARRRSVVLDGRALRARARGPRRPPRHRRALPRRRPVVGRHARPAARARAPARAAERGRGRLAVLDPRPSSRAATSCSTRWTPHVSDDDPRRRAQRRDLDAGVPGRGHGVLQAPRLPGRSVARRGRAQLRRDGERPDGLRDHERADGVHRRRDDPRLRHHRSPARDRGARPARVRRARRGPPAPHGGDARAPAPRRAGASSRTRATCRTSRSPTRFLAVVEDFLERCEA